MMHTEYFSSIEEFEKMEMLAQLGAEILKNAGERSRYYDNPIKPENKDTSCLCLDKSIVESQTPVSSATNPCTAHSISHPPKAQ